MARAKKGQVSSLKIKKAVLYIGGEDLLVHRFSSKALYEMIGKQMQLATAGREARDPQFEHVRSIHYLPGKRFGFPSRALKSALVRGADFTKIMKMTEAKGAIFVCGEKVPSPLGSDRMLELVGIPSFHAKPVRVAGQAAMRFRAEFQEWAAAVPIEFNEALVSIEQIVQMLMAAGYGCGIGEDSARKGGELGKFTQISQQQHDALKKRISKEREAWFKTNADAISAIDQEDRRLIDLLMNPLAQVALDESLRAAGRTPKGKPKLAAAVNGEATHS